MLFGLLTKVMFANYYLIIHVQIVVQLYVGTCVLTVKLLTVYFLFENNRKHNTNVIYQTLRLFQQ